MPQRTIRKNRGLFQCVLVAGTMTSLPASALAVEAAAHVPNVSMWTEQAKLVRSTGTGNIRLGNSVALAGDIAVLAAPLDGSSIGSAYVFVRNGATWTEQAKLVPPDGATGDQFGTSVAVSGTTILVGAYNNSNKGAAYVFVQNGASWTMQAKLAAVNDLGSDWFGYSSALDGDTAIIGSVMDDDKGTDSGSAYVFTRNGTQWSQEAKLVADDGATSDGFGVSVSISGNTAVVGSYQDDDKGSNSGSAYVFVRNGAVWSQQAKLTASNGMADDRFGYSVAISGNDVIIGADRNDEKGLDAGVAYAYARSGNTWSERTKMLAGDGTAGDNYGHSVAIAGNVVVVGAYNDDDKGNNSGAVYALGGLATDGNPCAAMGDCASGYCVDGVCCNAACGNGDTTDCQACSATAGAATNGICGPIAAGTQCRASANPCDAAEMCNGTGTQCPNDAPAPNGTVCPGGLCMNGMCAGQGGAGGNTNNGGAGGIGGNGGAGGIGGNGGSSSSAGGSAGNGGTGGNAGSGNGNGGAAGNAGGEGGAGGSGNTSGDNGNCGCRTISSSAASPSGIGFSLFGLALMLRRRRRASSRFFAPR